MSSKQVLVVEDDNDIREMLCFSLEKAGYVVVASEDAEQALQTLGVMLPDLMLVDWMLPGMNGPEFVRRVRRDDLTRKIPVMMLTARGEESDVLQGFENGADDYLIKPFSPKELLARMKALLRRSNNDQEGSLKVRDLLLDVQAHRLSVAGEMLDTGPTEFKLLEFFMQHPDRVYSREQLLDRVWGRNVYVEERTVDVHILRLRKLLSPYGYDKFVQTVRGSGYRFSDQ
ncbi:MAG: phosphate regulon transcriptional regulator PhoB [Gammaproteobacteria bacterium]|nr:phosphate regulon transcriptional regulator PhoB [Gammaproteobacteria bacterium]MDH5734830.1 phosphate regulon transcriptional regulator PhoB [Gammaproteobacteria bacterium]